jgi:hypothetical protein
VSRRHNGRAGEFISADRGTPGAALTLMQAAGKTPNRVGLPALCTP